VRGPRLSAGETDSTSVGVMTVVERVSSSRSAEAARGQQAEVAACAGKPTWSMQRTPNSRRVYASCDPDSRGGYAERVGAECGDSDARYLSRLGPVSTHSRGSAFLGVGDPEKHLDVVSSSSQGPAEIRT